LQVWNLIRNSVNVHLVFWRFPLLTTVLYKMIRKVFQLQITFEICTPIACRLFHVLWLWKWSTDLYREWNTLAPQYITFFGPGTKTAEFLYIVSQYLSRNIQARPTSARRCGNNNTIFTRACIAIWTARSYTVAALLGSLRSSGWLLRVGTWPEIYPLSDTCPR